MGLLKPTAPPHPHRDRMKIGLRDDQATGFAPQTHCRVGTTPVRVGLMMSSDLHEARYAAMRWNAPLSVDHAALLLDRLDLRPGAAVLDLGCGWGQLLLMAVQVAGDGATGVGVDNDEQLLVRARGLAAPHAVHGRVVFVHGESAAWDQAADRVLCVGASHAWDGVSQALSALTQRVRPGGRMLFAEGCWERSPTAAAATFGDGVISLAEMVRLARAAGWQVLHLSTADQREWDDFEASWRRGRQQWLLEHADDDRAVEVQDKLDQQLTEYVEVYRGVLGFGYLVLGR